MEAIASNRLQVERSLLLVGLLLMCVMVGVGSANNALIVAVLCVPVVLVALFLRPQAGLYALLLGVYSLDWLSRVLGLLPPQVRWLPDLILVALSLIVVTRVVFRDQSPRRTVIDVPLLALLVLGSLSALINGSELATALNGFRSLLKPLLFFCVLGNLNVGSRALKRLIILLIVLELLQIPITILQALIFGAGDDVGGSLGHSATQIGTLMALIVMSLLFGLAMVSRRPWLGFLAGTCLFVPVLLGEGKFAFFIAPPMVLFILAPQAANRAKTLVTVSILLALAYFVTLQTMPVVAPRSQLADFLRSPMRIFQEYERPLSETGVPVSRLGDIQFALELVRHQPGAVLLGYGPGEASPSFFGDVAGRIYAKYEYLGSVFGKTQFGRGLLEWGVLGLLLYVYSVLSVYRINQQSLQHSDRDPFWRGIALGFRGVVLVFLASTVFWYAWQSDATAYVFWMLAAACSNPELHSPMAPTSSKSGP